MNDTKKKSRPLLFFYILVVYVLLQFAWWSYMMIGLSNEVYHLKSELNLLKAASPEEVMAKGNELEAVLHKKWVMIVSEAVVFLILLLLGFLRVRGTFKKERELALQQKNFLLSVSHELKSPIASARLQLETLLKRKLDEPKQQELLTNALGDTKRLNNLVENILLAATIDNPSMGLHRENINVSDFMKEGMSQTLQAFQPKQKVEMDIQPGIFFAVDKNTFPSIPLNLFENALKYSPAESTITVKFYKKDNSIFLTMADEGQGIEENERENIFEKFYRVGNEETRRAKGTGLGLYIVRNLVEKHDGTISVKSNSPQGTVFIIQFNA